MNERGLAGKVALVVGAGRYPGPALVAGLASRGAGVAANDLSPILLDPLLVQNGENPGSVRTYVADASRGMPLRAMLDEVLDDWGRIDLLINNPRVRPEIPFLEMDEYDWQRTVEMNLNGPFLVMLLVARLMREQGGGVILNVVNADPGEVAFPGRAAYAASQAGLLALSRAAARELIAYNIRVHALCPDDGPDFPESQTPVDSRQDERWTGDLAGLAVYLSSPAASRLTGQVFRTGRPVGDERQEE